MSRRTHSFTRWRPIAAILLTTAWILTPIAQVTAQETKAKAPKPQAVDTVKWPPTLPGGAQYVTETIDGVTVDFLFFPGQNYRGKPWSAWGDGVAVGDKYYTSIGDHDRPKGRVLLFEYDSTAKKLRLLVDLKEFLEKSEFLKDASGKEIDYTPGKIHGRIDIGSDGWLYYSTHRGSARTTTDQYNFQGDSIYRTDPVSGKTEIVTPPPVPKHCTPNSVLDPERLIFYGATAAGADAAAKGVQFYAYDCKNKKLLYSGPNGPSRYMAFSRSTGRVYYVPDLIGELHRFDPAGKAKPEPLGVTLGLRAATQETPQGYIYTVAKDGAATLFRLDVKTEKAEKIGTLTLGGNPYVASLDADPTGRYLYYAPGAHGGAEGMGSPVAQYDTKTGKKRVVVKLAALKEKYNFLPMGSFGTAVSPDGKKVYVTWMGWMGGGKKGTPIKEVCALTVVHVPEALR